MTVGIVHPDSGNITSIRDALARLGLPHVLLRNPDLSGVSALVLPGQGRFGPLMAFLRGNGWLAPLRNWCAADRPLLAICAGMQALLDASEEDPGVAGLGIFAGKALRLCAAKVPMIGWAEVLPRDGDFPAGAAYFANSFVLGDHHQAWAYSDYGGRFCSALKRGRLRAVQFHPEKSGAWGKEILSRCLVC